MNWSDFIDFIIKHLIELIIAGFSVSFITYFIIKPYMRYLNLREELSVVLYKNAPIAHNTGLSQQSYNDTYDELRRMGGEITGFINSTKLEIFMRLLKVPDKNDMNDAIKKLNRIMNSLNRPYMLTQIFKDHQRIYEIFKIEH